MSLVVAYFAGLFMGCFIGVVATALCVSDDSEGEQ